MKYAEKFQCNFYLDDRGDILDYLGINFAKTKDGIIKINHTQLVDQKISEVGVDRIIISKPMLAPSTYVLYRDIKASAFDN